MEGARMLDEWPIVEKVVWSLDLVYQKVPVAQPVIPAEDEDEVEVIEDTTLARRSRDKRVDPIRVSRAEWSVYELVDGQKTVAEINELAFLSEFDGCKAFFDLVSRGLIEESMPHAVEAPDEPGVSAGVPAARAPRAPLDLNVVAGVGLALLLAVAVRFQASNPLNLVTLPPRRAAVVDGYEKSVSLLKLRRLAEGVDTYTLIAGRLPDDARDARRLADRRSRGTSRIPGGRSTATSSRARSSISSGSTLDGRTDPDLLFSRTLVLRETKEQELSPHSSREITVVE